MLGLKRLKVAQYERALVFRERSLERVLNPGMYWLWDPLKLLAVQVYDVNAPELILPRADVLVSGIARLARAGTCRSSSSAIARWAWSTRTSASQACWRRVRASSTGVVR